MKKDTIFISNFHPFTTRNIFDTGVLDMIAKEVGRVVVFVTKPKERYMKQKYERSNIVIHGIDDIKIVNSFQELFFHRISEVLIDTRTKRDHQLKYLIASRSPLRHIKYYLAILTIVILGNVNLIKQIFRSTENILHRPRNFEFFFNHYKPELVFVTDIFAQIDTVLLKEAKQYEIKTVGLVRSWDNTTNKGILRVVPDRLIVQNELMKEECVKYHIVLPQKIHIVGVPQFEYYRQYKPISREDFCRSLGLDLKKRIILYSPAGQKYTETDWQICEILKHLYLEGKIPKDAQFLIRQHPHNFADLSKFKPDENFVIEDPGAGFVGERKKVVEMTLASVNHLADTLYHSAVVINVVSSIVVDAAIFNKPIVTIGFNGCEKSVPYLKSIERVQRQEWLAALNNTGVAPAAHNPDELASLLNEYLANPEQDAALRRKFVEGHCYKFDGRAAERMARAVLEL